MRDLGYMTAVMLLRYSRGCWHRTGNHKSNEVTMNIETVIYRIANDAEFARAIAEDPVAAIEAHGLKLHPEELAALRAAMSTPSGSNLITGATGDRAEPTAPWFAPQFKGVTAEPTAPWFAPQFKGVTADPID